MYKFSVFVWIVRGEIFCTSHVQTNETFNASFWLEWKNVHSYAFVLTVILTFGCAKQNNAKEPVFLLQNLMFE